jgi:hypothetical protein
MPVTLPPALPGGAAGRHVLKPDSDHTGTISITVRARRASWNAMKPGSSAFWRSGIPVSARPAGAPAGPAARTDQEAGRTVPMYMIWTGLLQPVEVFGR